MDNEIYRNLLEYYNEYGPFYISQNPKIKVDWFTTSPFVYKKRIFSACLDKDIFDIKKLLEEIDDKDSKFPVSSPYYTILTKLEEWNNMYTIADNYFSS